MENGTIQCDFPDLHAQEQQLGMGQQCAWAHWACSGHTSSPLLPMFRKQFTSSALTLRSCHEEKTYWL